MAGSERQNKQVLLPAPTTCTLHAQTEKLWTMKGVDLPSFTLVQDSELLLLLLSKFLTHSFLISRPPSQAKTLLSLQHNHEICSVTNGPLPASEKQAQKLGGKQALHP